MRRILLTLATAGSFAAFAASIAPIQQDPVPSPPQMTTVVMLNANDTQPGQSTIANEATSASSNKALSRTDEDGNLSIYGTLVITLVVMATIALRRTRHRKS